MKIQARMKKSRFEREVTRNLRWVLKDNDKKCKEEQRQELFRRYLVQEWWI